MHGTCSHQADEQCLTWTNEGPRGPDREMREEKLTNRPGMLDAYRRHQLWNSSVLRCADACR